MIILEGYDHISLTVGDLARSIAFYKDVFGFDILDQSSEFAKIQAGEIVIMLQVGEVAAQPAGNYVCFRIDEQDFDDYLEELEEAKIRFEENSAGEDGPRMAMIMDPDGNRIIFAC